MNNFLISGFYSEFQTNLLIRVFDKHKNNRIKIWVNKNFNFDLINKNIQNIELFDYHDCIRGINKFNNQNGKKDFSGLLKFANQYSDIFIKMYDRFDPNHQYNNKYKLDHFQYLLKNWSTKIKDQKINRVLFYANPHVLYDFAIYVICKYYKIKIIIQEDSKYFSTIFFIHNIEDLSKIGRKFKRIVFKKNLKKIKNLIESYKNFSVEKYIGNIDFFSNTYEKNNSSYFKIFYWAFLRPFINYNFNLFEIYNFFFKRQKNAIWNYSSFPYYNLKSLPTCFQDQFYYFKKKFQLDLLNKQLSRLAVEPNLQKNYVVFYDSVIPEKSIVPDAVCFYDTKKLLNNIINFLPEDWIIYYKEHPKAHKLVLDTHLGKKYNYYEGISKIPNVFIINQDFDKEKLLKYSKFSITKTGEIGIQSVVNGIPTLNCGHAWYSSCPGVIHVKNYGDLRSSINRVIKIKKINRKDVYYFLNDLIKNGLDFTYLNMNLQWNNYESFTKKKGFNKFFKKLSNNYKKKLPV
jgi:hypothetical protein